MIRQQPRFASVSCAQCGQDLGPGDCGVSACTEHALADRVRLLELLETAIGHLTWARAALIGSDATIATKLRVDGAVEALRTELEKFE